VNLMRRPEVKRLVTVLMVMAMVTLMTGESGDASTPTTVPRRIFEKVSYFVCSRAALDGLPDARPARLRTHVSLSALTARQCEANPYGDGHPKRFVQMRSSRFAVLRVVIVIALSIHISVTQSYWMYLIVEQVGVWILLAEGLNVCRGHSRDADWYVPSTPSAPTSRRGMTGVLPAPPSSTTRFYAVGDPDRVLARWSWVMLGIPTLRLPVTIWPFVTLGFALIIDDT